MCRGISATCIVLNSVYSITHCSVEHLVNIKAKRIDATGYETRPKTIRNDLPMPHTVKQLIIGEDLFGEIGEIINFAKISSHQLKKIWTPTTFFQ